MIGQVWCVVIADKDERHFGRVGSFYTMDEAIIFCEVLDPDNIAAVMTREAPNFDLTLCEMAT